MSDTGVGSSASQYYGIIIIILQVSIDEIRIALDVTVRH